MPELAEVEYFRKQWNTGLNQKILHVDLHANKRLFRGIDPDIFVKKLTGAKFLESRAHGKQMLFHFSHNAWLGLHLGMTGKLRVEKPSFIPQKHDHLVLWQKKQLLIFSDPRLFGRVLFHVGKSEPEWWTRLPASLTSSEFTIPVLKDFLLRHAKAPIKAALLMQQGFPGIGNWMADEILWQSKINPRQTSGKIQDAKFKVLHQKVRFVSQQALKIIGENYDDPPKTWLFGYRWKKKGICPRCGGVLKHAAIGGRTTCWCPKCQGEDKKQ